MINSCTPEPFYSNSESYCSYEKFDVSPTTITWSPLSLAKQLLDDLNAHTLLKSSKVHQREPAKQDHCLGGGGVGKTKL